MDGCLIVDGKPEQSHLSGDSLSDGRGEEKRSGRRAKEKGEGSSRVSPSVHPRVRPGQVEEDSREREREEGLGLALSDQVYRPFGNN